jgi:hypothetical protein
MRAAAVGKRRAMLVDDGPRGAGRLALIIRATDVDAMSGWIMWARAAAFVGSSHNTGRKPCFAKTRSMRSSIAESSSTTSTASIG